MKISEIQIEGFKRFTNLKIENIPVTAKIIIVIGPNGSGKSSLFDAMHRWYRNHLSDYYAGRDDLYYAKNQYEGFNYDKAINISFHDFSKTEPIDKKKIEGKFYFRSAYRNQADFTISTLTKLTDPTKTVSFDNLIQNDATVEKNYQRLVSMTLASIYDQTNDNKLVKDLRDDLIGKLRKTLSNVFEDLTLSSIGDPLHNGTFYFEKGTSKNYHYKNLSGGEKAAFDIILDLIIKTAHFNDAIYCIDEPEIHMHTGLQSALFNEIYGLMPDNSQLWINTHSLGILKKARQLETEYPGSICFINFDEFDFDSPVIIQPSKIDKPLWQKFIHLTLDDYSDFISPEKIILCEGDPLGKKNKNFDATIYNKIFADEFPNTLFISLGGSNELENDTNISYQILKGMFKNTIIIRLVDGDDRNEIEIEELNQRNIKVLSLRHIEAYLWKDEIIKKFCLNHNSYDKVGEVLSMKNEKLQKSIDRQNPKDDIKSASNEIYQSLKKLLGLTKTGNDTGAFLRDNIAPLITEETETYQLLKSEIFC